MNASTRGLPVSATTVSAISSARSSTVAATRTSNARRSHERRLAPRLLRELRLAHDLLNRGRIGRRDRAHELERRRVDDAQLTGGSDRHAGRLRRDAIEVGEQARDPLRDVVLPDLRLDRPRAPAALVRGSIVSASWSASACPQTSNGFTVTAHSPSSSCAPAFSESTSTPSRVVHERAFLRDEVHPVVDRIHEQHVVLLVGRDRLREVVRDLHLERQPAWNAVLDARGLRRDRRRGTSTYSGIVSRDGSSRASISTRPRHSGCSSSRSRTRGSRGRCSSTDRCGRRERSASPAGQRRAPPRAPPRSRASASNSSTSIEIGWCVTSVAAAQLAAVTSRVLRSKFRAHRRVWKPTTSFASKPVVESAPHLLGQHTSSRPATGCARSARASRRAAPRAPCAARDRGGSRGRRRSRRVVSSSWATTASANARFTAS